MKRLDKIGRLTLACIAIVAAFAILLMWLDILEPCQPGDQGISIGHMLTEGCR